MKKSIILSVLHLASYAVLIAQNGIDHSSEFTHSPGSTLTFKENKGQVHDQNYQPRPDVLFSGTDGQMVYHLKKDGISYQLNRVDSWKEMENVKATPGAEKQQVPDQTTIYRLDVKWLNTNTNTDITTGALHQGTENYYTAVCPDGVRGVRSFNDVTYQNIYSGIDLKWYTKDGSLKYDYIVSAGADYTRIQLQFEGAETLSINDKGELVIKTPLGKLIEQAPLVFQNGKTLSSRWIIKNQIASFEIDNVDMQNEFTIDPGVRAWGTYYGGVNQDLVYSCATDALGNSYMAGFTQSTTNIATAGAHQSVGSGAGEAFLVKFDTNGQRIWGTYYGGNVYSQGKACAVDISGNVYLAGETQSTSGIATVGAHQTAFNGGVYDGFLVKFNSTGVRQWATYYGGTGVELIYSCASDASGNVILAGETQSTTSIASIGAHQVAFGGNLDAFIVKFNASGVRQWASYYGGAANDHGYSCAVDPSGNIFLSGQSPSITNIATVGAHQQTPGGLQDAFLVKFNSGGVRQWGTYYGGNAVEYGYWCATDNSGNIYLAGNTVSSSGISTPGSHQDVYAGGNSGDAFLVKLNPSGVRLWATYYGGSADDFGYSCVVDANGSVYLAGTTQGNTGIATPGSHQVTSGGVTDAFIVKFDASGVRQWGTFYGGNSGDYGYSCCVSSGVVYMAGYTNSSAAISSAGAHQTTYVGNNDAFIVKFLDVAPLTFTQHQINASCNGSCDALAIVTPSGGVTPYSYAWSPSGGSSSTASALCAGTYTCTITDATAATTTATFNITQPAALSDYPVSPDTTSFCSSDSVVITLSGSSPGVNYSLLNGATVIDGPYSGTGSALLFNTGNVSTTTTYNIYAEEQQYANALNLRDSGIVQTPSNLSAFITNDITISMWIKPDSVQQLYANVLSSHGNGGGFTIEQLNTVNNTYYFGWCYNNTCTGGNVVVQLTPNVWQNYTIVKSGSSVTHYVNGVQMATGNGTYSTIGAGYPMVIGDWTAGARNFNGQIDDLSIWNIAMTPGQISTNMNACLLGNENGLVSYYKMNEANSASTANDIGPADNNGTLTNMNLNAAWVSGTTSCFSGGCNTQMSQSSTVLINSPPSVNWIPADSLYCLQSGAIALSGGQPTGGVYSGPGVTGNQFDPSQAGIGFHVLTYTYTDASGCSASVSDTVEVSVCTGEIPFGLSGFSIAPNPASEKLVISSPEVGFTYRLYDVLGNEVKVIRNASVMETMEIADLARGVYVLQGENKGAIIAAKVIVSDN